MKHELVLVIDFGGQYNQLIARRVRENNVYCEIISYKTDIEEIKAKNPKGIIFTGGPNSAYLEDSPRMAKEIYEAGIPILGICYGIQTMCHTLGGVVRRGTAAEKEYGKTAITYKESKHPPFCHAEVGFPDFPFPDETVQQVPVLHAFCQKKDAAGIEIDAVHREGRRFSPFRQKTVHPVQHGVLCFSCHIQGKKACRLIDRQDMVILIDNIRRRQRPFLLQHKGAEPVPLLKPVGRFFPFPVHFDFFRAQGFHKKRPAPALSFHKKGVQPLPGFPGPDSPFFHRLSPVTAAGHAMGPAVPFPDAPQGQFPDGTVNKAVMFAGYVKGTAHGLGQGCHQRPVLLLVYDNFNSSLVLFNNLD